MKKFLYKTTFFIFLFSLLLIAILNVSNRKGYRTDYKPWETKGNLFFVQDSSYYDFIILGTSRANHFTLCENHQRVENILNKKFINFSLDGASIKSQEVYLDYFFKRDGKTREIIYLIDPFVLISDEFDDITSRYQYEPLKWDFLPILIKDGVTSNSIIKYLNTKLTKDWIYQNRIYCDTLALALDSIKTEDQGKRQKYLYSKSINEKKLRKKKKIIKSILETSERHKCKISFIILPTLLDERKGNEYIENILSEYSDQYTFSFYNFQNENISIEYFADLDHLNSKGIVYITKKYFKPLLLQ